MYPHEDPHSHAHQLKSAPENRMEALHESHHRHHLHQHHHHHQQQQQQQQQQHHHDPQHEQPEGFLLARATPLEKIVPHESLLLREWKQRNGTAMHENPISCKQPHTYAQQQQQQQQQNLFETGDADAVDPWSLSCSTVSTTTSSSPNEVAPAEWHTCQWDDSFGEPMDPFSFDSKPQELCFDNDKDDDDGDDNNELEEFECFKPQKVFSSTNTWFKTVTPKLIEPKMSQIEITEHSEIETSQDDDADDLGFQQEQKQDDEKWESSVPDQKKSRLDQPHKQACDKQMEPIDDAGNHHHHHHHLHEQEDEDEGRRSSHQSSKRSLNSNSSPKPNSKGQNAQRQRHGHSDSQHSSCSTGHTSRNHGDHEQPTQANEHAEPRKLQPSPNQNCHSNQYPEIRRSNSCSSGSSSITSNPVPEDQRNNAARPVVHRVPSLTETSHASTESLDSSSLGKTMMKQQHSSKPKVTPARKFVTFQSPTMEEIEEDDYHRRRNSWNNTLSDANRRLQRREEEELQNSSQFLDSVDNKEWKPPRQNSRYSRRRHRENHQEDETSRTNAATTSSTASTSTGTNSSIYTSNSESANRHHTTVIADQDSQSKLHSTSRINHRQQVGQRLLHKSATEGNPTQGTNNRRRRLHQTTRKHSTRSVSSSSSSSIWSLRDHSRERRPDSNRSEQSSDHHYQHDQGDPSTSEGRHQRSSRGRRTDEEGEEHRRYGRRSSSEGRRSNQNDCHENHRGRNRRRCSNDRHDHDRRRSSSRRRHEDRRSSKSRRRQRSNFHLFEVSPDMIQKLIAAAKQSTSLRRVTAPSSSIQHTPKTSHKQKAIPANRGSKFATTPNAAPRTQLSKWEILEERKHQTSRLPPGVRQCNPLTTNSLFCHAVASNTINAFDKAFAHQSSSAPPTGPSAAIAALVDLFGNHSPANVSGPNTNDVTSKGGQERLHTSKSKSDSAIMKLHRMDSKGPSYSRGRLMEKEARIGTHRRFRRNEATTTSSARPDNTTLEENSDTTQDNNSNPTTSTTSTKHSEDQNNKSKERPGPRRRPILQRSNSAKRAAPEQRILPSTSKSFNCGSVCKSDLTSITPSTLFTASAKTIADPATATDDSATAKSSAPRVFQHPPNMDFSSWKLSGIPPPKKPVMKPGRPRYQRAVSNGSSYGAKSSNALLQESKRDMLRKKTAGLRRKMLSKSRNDNRNEQGHTNDIGNKNSGTVARGSRPFHETTTTTKSVTTKTNSAPKTTTSFLAPIVVNTVAVKNHRNHINFNNIGELPKPHPNATNKTTAVTALATTNGTHANPTNTTTTGPHAESAGKAADWIDFSQVHYFGTTAL